MDREVVKELIQNELNFSNVKWELEKILDPVIRERIFYDYAQLQNILNTGGAAHETAKGIVNDLKKKSLI
jgi:lipid-A-disaccharide synthase